MLLLKLKKQAGSSKKNPVPLLNMEFIAKYDATGVGEVLFKQDPNDTAHNQKSNSAWSVVALFSVLGNDQTKRVLYGGKEKTFDTLTDLRDSMFLVEAFRHAFIATFKGSVKALTLATEPAVKTPTLSLVSNILNDIIKELNMFANRELLANFYHKLTQYKSADSDIFSKDFKQSAAHKVSDCFLLAIINGHDAYHDIKTLTQHGVYNTLETLQQYSNHSTQKINQSNFIDNAHQIFNTLKEHKFNQLQWLPKTIQEIQDLVQQDTKIGLATRYALSQLDSTVLLTGFDFDQYNENGELDLVSKNNPDGMTQKYINARSEMLLKLVNYCVIIIQIIEKNIDKDSYDLSY